MQTICLIDVQQPRHNVVSNLVAGLYGGFRDCGIHCYVQRYVKRDTRKYILPATIPRDVTHVLAPYWLTEEVWDINFAELKATLPKTKIAIYCGKYPFGAQCAEGSELKVGTAAASSVRKVNCAAVDLILVVRQEASGTSRVREVGMGALAELTCEPKSLTPLVVLDFAKPGWDEQLFGEAAYYLGALLTKIPNLNIQVLDESRPIPNLNDTRRISFLPSKRVQFDVLAKIWKESWSTIVHNESFGYSIIENWLSGTTVFAAPGAMLPAWQQHMPLDSLEPHLLKWLQMSPEQRNRAARCIAQRYANTNPMLCSWGDTARRIATAFARC